MALAIETIDNLGLFLLDSMDFRDSKGHGRGRGVRKAYGVPDWHGHGCNGQFRRRKSHGKGLSGRCYRSRLAVISRRRRRFRRFVLVLLTLVENSITELMAGEGVKDIAYRRNQ